MDVAHVTPISEGRDYQVRYELKPTSVSDCRLMQLEMLQGFNPSVCVGGHWLDGRMLSILLTETDRPKLEF